MSGFILQPPAKATLFGNATAAALAIATYDQRQNDIAPDVYQYVIEVSFSDYPAFAGFYVRVNDLHGFSMGYLAHGEG